MDDLVKEGLVIVGEAKEAWIEARGDFEDQSSGWASSRTIILKPQLVDRAGQLGEQLTVECQVADPYHERRILVSTTKLVTLFSKFFH
jgi:hypothetical protein